MSNPKSPPSDDARKWRLACKYFRSTFQSWDELFSDAARFATSLGPELVVNVSHSADANKGVVAVWYWTQEVEAKATPATGGWS